jgi:uncharacterized delta-60 repeat protein
MSWTSWLRSRRTASRPTRAHPCQDQSPRRTSLLIEQLEDRCLLSGGVLDPTFGTGGLVTTLVGSYAQAFAVATYSNEGTANDGKIVAAGDAYLSAGNKSTLYMAVVRYNLDGSLDRTFAGTGEAITAPGGRALAVQVQPDGKIVVAGNSGSHFAVVRYNANGTLDTSFGSNGEVITSISKNSIDTGEAMVLQADGKIVVAGHTNPMHTTYEDLALVRYNANGTLDTSFGTGGMVTTHFALPLDGHWNPHNLNLAIDPNASPLDPNSGKIVVGAQTQEAGALVVRYKTDGTLDTGFGANHTGYLNLGTLLYNAAVAVQSDDAIVVAGSVNDQLSGTDFSLDRLNPDGTLDTSFGSGGVVVTSSAPNGDYAGGVTIQADGKIVVTGQQTNTLTGVNSFMVARYNTNGSLDATFGVNGIATGGARSIGGGTAAVALEPDGRIVVAGHTQDQGPEVFSLARFLAAGPQIGSLTASQPELGGSVSLTASNITDANPGATITQLAFYADSNGDGVLDAGDAQLTGTLTYVSGTWTLTFSPAMFGLTPGNTYTLFAQAEDSYGVFGDPLTLTLLVVQA